MQNANEEKRCKVSGKLCFTERAAGAVLNSFKHHHSGRSKKNLIPRRKYFCKSCGFYHLTHITKKHGEAWDNLKGRLGWHKECINGKWFSIANARHVPDIEHCKDGLYKLRNAFGKIMLYSRFKDAEKAAFETARKFRKFNKRFCA